LTLIQEFHFFFVDVKSLAIAKENAKTGKTGGYSKCFVLQRYDV
jgi:hypothetical protein